MNKKLKKENNVGATISRPEKGITLVALVITIIVLIILAGVSINAVMNGGLITNAKDAKNQYEEGKVNESIDISNYTSKTEIYVAEKELEKEGITYNTSKKYITGIKLDGTIETVKSFMERNTGYVVYKDGTKVTDTEAETLTMATGMVVKKVGNNGNETEIGKVIVYGEIYGDGLIDLTDVDQIVKLLNKDDSTIIKEDIYKIAADVNHDGKVDLNDCDLIVNYVGFAIDHIEQNVEAGEIPTIIYNEE